jgi:hypothetical protein
MVMLVIPTTEQTVESGQGKTRVRSYLLFPPDINFSFNTLAAYVVLTTICHNDRYSYIHIDIKFIFTS